MIKAFHFISPPSTHITLNVFYLFTDADKQPADSLINIAALVTYNLLVKMPDISKGVFFNIQQTLFKEWGPESLGVLPEDTMQELLTGVTFNFQIFIFTTCFDLLPCLFLPLLSSYSL